LSIIGAFIYNIFEPDWTKRRFDKIKPGMSMENVKDIIGEPELIDTNDISWMKGKVFYVNTSKLKSEPSVVYFDSNDRVVSKVWGDK
jgi:outer membrane protein assembly factor BamE (lipoprotein component of BamABCDE complex)